jgi:simple sugar transport system permease protein
LKEAALALAVAGAAILASLAAGAILIVAAGQNPFEVYGTLLREALGSSEGLTQVLFKTTTLLFTGIAAAFAFRAGMFNIGGEGQIYLGAFTCALVGLALPAGTPGLVAMPLLTVAAFAGGLVAAAPPAILKAVRGTHEVIVTMMMNFIVLAVVNWLLTHVRVSPEAVWTREVPADWRLPLFVRGYDGNMAFVLGVLACGVAMYVLACTRLGFELRAVGFNPKAAENGGVPVRRHMMTSLLISGGLAGLGGVNFVLGSPGKFEQGFAPFQGYLGIAVALLARNHPIGVIPAAFLFAVLAEGSQSVQQYVPKEIGHILQAIVILFVVIGGRVLERVRDAMARKAQAAHG